MNRDEQRRIYEENRREQERQQRHQAEMAAAAQRAQDKERQRMRESQRHQDRIAQSISGRPACVPSGTPVLTPGGWRPIARIEPGDVILTIGRHGGLVRCHVKARHDYAARAIWRVETTDPAKPLETTASHTFLTSRGWVRASRLQVGDVLVTVNGQDSRVLRLVQTGRCEPVHNLITEREHTFIAAGYVAHNFTYFRRLRTTLHRAWQTASKWLGVPEFDPAPAGAGRSSAR